MTGWKVDDTIALVARAWLWLVAVTVPLVCLSAVSWWATVTVVVSGLPWALDDALSVVWMLLLVDGVTAVAALGGAVVSLPCTHALGVLLVGVRSGAVQVLATTVLAGGLGCATAWIAGEVSAPGSGPFFGAFIGVTAAGAGALARWGQLRSAARRAADVRRPDAVWP